MRPTDLTLLQVEKKIRKEYSQAMKEVQSKLDEHFRLFKIKDQTKRRQLAQGKITLQEYKKWRVGQMAVGDRWEKLRNQLAQDLQNTRQIARSITVKHMPEAYAFGHDYMIYNLEKDIGMQSSFTLYKVEAIEEIVAKNPQLLPPPGRRMLGRIARGEAVQWEEGRLQSIAMQAILQGESVPNMARRICDTLQVSEMRDAMRYARTAINSAESRGDLAALYEARDLGVHVKKQWSATLDDRTRKAHRELDGQTQELEDPFVNSIGEIMFPGDTDADGDNYWNCRCAMDGTIRGFERDKSDLRYRRHNLGNMSYDEWKKQTGKSRDIMNPVKVEQQMKALYARDYRR